MLDKDRDVVNRIVSLFNLIFAQAYGKAESFLLFLSCYYFFGMLLGGKRGQETKVGQESKVVEGDEKTDKEEIKS